MEVFGSPKINKDTFNEVVIPAVFDVFEENIKLYTKSNLRKTMFRHCKIYNKCYFAFCLEDEKRPGRYDTNYLIEVIFSENYNYIIINVRDSEYGDAHCKDRVILISNDKYYLEWDMKVKQPFLKNLIVKLYYTICIRLQINYMSFANIAKQLIDEQKVPASDHEYSFENYNYVESVFQVTMHEVGTYYRRNLEPIPQNLKAYCDDMHEICDLALKISNETGHKVKSEIIKSLPRRSTSRLKELAHRMHLEDEKKETSKSNMPEIKKIIYNAPAVIVLWSDSTKTMAKCEKGHEDEFDPEIGLSIAVAKKYFGNQHQLRKRLPKE